MMQIAHAINAQPLSSNKIYQHKHQLDDIGRGITADGIEHYPAYLTAKNANKNFSRVSVFN